MILSGSGSWTGTSPLWLAAAAVIGYVVATWPGRAARVAADGARDLGPAPLGGGGGLPMGAAAAALFAGWTLHLFVLVFDIGGWGQTAEGARLGFAPVLSMTVWLVIAVHTVESRFVPLPAVRRVLAASGAAAVALAWVFPGDVRAIDSTWAPLHFALGVASYGLFGVAVLHAALLGNAERRLRLRGPDAGHGNGMPLLQLERLTFRFVDAGFVVLTATLALGIVHRAHWQWDHKTVFSLLGWAVFAALLLGRHLRGWRGRQATRWLYAGALLLLLSYVGSRFVLEVLLHRPL
ncbi:MAG: cytochrome c biogenesis protein CcsA [Rubrivivax sp.]